MARSVARVDVAAGRPVHDGFMHDWPLSWRLLAVGALPVALLGGVLLVLYLGGDVTPAAVGVATGSALVLGGGLGLWVSAGIRRALDRLRETFAAWERGERKARAALSGGAELGTVARAFDRMAEKLQSGLDRAERTERAASERLRQRLEEVDRKEQALELEKSRIEAAGLARSRWLADMSHELRTPLSAISGFSDLLADYGVDATHRSYVENIRRASSELLLMIGEILDFAKIEAGEVEIHRRPFDFYDEMEGIVSLMGRLAHARGLDFLTFLDPRIPDRVVSDPQRIRQAVVNLLSNAVKFTDQGYVALEVRLEEAGPALEFRVIDTGVGIEPDAAERLFQPFAQGGGALQAQAAGTGLGLSITKYFVERLGGRVGCTGAPGEGSTFWIRVPVALEEDSQVYHQREPLGARRTLVFDRHPVRSRYTLELLQAWGVDTDHASELETFRARYLGGGYDTILYFLNRSDVDTDLQVSIGDLSRAAAAKFFFHAADHPGPLDPGSGFRHLSTLISPRRLHRLLAEAQGQGGAGESSASVPAAAPRMEGLGGRRVLIADDNEINRHLLGVYVGRNDGEPVFAEDGLAALDAAEAQRPHVALLDIHMPRLSGDEAAVELRRRFPELKLVAVTAETRSERLKALRDQGFDAVLVKPVTERRLLETITALCPPPPGSGRGSKRSELVDIEKAVRLAGGKPALAEELYGMLLADLRAKREQLVYRTGEDRERLRNLAHRIHGGARYCAAEQVQRAAQRLEYVTESGRSEAEIEAALDRLRTAIDELLGAPNPYRRLA